MHFQYSLQVFVDMDGCTRAFIEARARLPQVDFPCQEVASIELSPVTVDGAVRRFKSFIVDCESAAQGV